jgi:hypothetical protein
MKISNIITNPFTWIILLIIISIVLYFSISKPHYNDRKTCSLNEELINDECVSKCNDGQVRCGSTMSCYDPIQEYCDSKFQVCSITNKDCNKCCPDGYTCSNGTCIECDIKCGKKCCDDKTPNCCNDVECCTKDSKCTKLDGCCEEPNVVCGDHCCNVSAGLNCIENKCQISCPPIDPITKRLPDGFTGNPIACDPNTSVCFKHPSIKDVNSQYQCLPKGCDWGDLYYTPRQDYLDSKNNPIHVCSDIHNNSLWIKGKGNDNNVNDLKSTVNVSITNFDSEKCTDDTCFQKIYQDGSTVITSGLTSGKIDDKNRCTSNLLCDKLLITDQNDLNAVCNNTQSTLHGQCCIDDNGNYSGQICPLGHKCLVNTCIQIGNYDPYCNNNGTTSFNTSTNQITCICKTPTEIYDKYYCNKIKSVDYFNKEFFKVYLSNKSSSVYGNNWNVMFVFIVSNHVKNWMIVNWGSLDVTADVSMKVQDVFKNDVTQSVFEEGNVKNTIAFQIKSPDYDSDYIAWATYYHPPNQSSWQLQSGNQDNGEPFSSLPLNYIFYAAGDIFPGSAPCLVIYASTYIDGTDDPHIQLKCEDYYNKNFFVNKIKSYDYGATYFWYLWVFVVCNDEKNWVIEEWNWPAMELVDNEYAIYDGGVNDIAAFQIKDSKNNNSLVAWATYKYTNNGGANWQLQSGNQDNGEPLSSLPPTHIFYNCGELFSGSPACLVIVAAKNVNGTDD